jgi:dipeptidyl aminopeptidase/acylaminoacyl peptidase
MVNSPGPRTDLWWNMSDSGKMSSRSAQRLSFAMYRPTERLAPTLAVANDGSLLAYVDDRSGQFSVVIRSLTSGTERRVIQFTDLAVHDVAVDPAAEWVYFFADREGDENGQLYRVAVDADAEPERLTTSPGATHEAGYGPGFSPDGRWFALSGNDREPGEQDILILDTRSGVLRRALVGEGLSYAGHWSPDGRQLTVLEWRSTRSDRAVHVIDVADDDLTVRLLTDPETTASYDVGPWLPDGSGFLVATDVGREFAGLALITPATGELTWWDTPDWDVRQVTLAPDGSTAAWVMLRNSADSIRVRVPATGETWDVPDLPLCSLTHLTLSPTGTHAWAIAQTPTRPANIARIDLRSGAIDWITQVAPTAADPAYFIEPSVVSYPSRDRQAAVAGRRPRPRRRSPAAALTTDLRRPDHRSPARHPGRQRPAGPAGGERPDRRPGSRQRRPGRLRALPRRGPLLRPAREPGTGLHPGRRVPHPASHRVIRCCRPVQPRCLVAFSQPGSSAGSRSAGPM